MSPKIRMTHATAMVLQALAHGYRYGFDIMEFTGLPGGTVYPILRRVEAARLVAAKWEAEGVAQRAGRPARRYYEILEGGQSALEMAVRRYRLVDEMGSLVPEERRG